MNICFSREEIFAGIYRGVIRLASVNAYGIREPYRLKSGNKSKDLCLPKQ